MRRLFLIRGASGSGKTETAKALKSVYELSGHSTVIAAADDYFYNYAGEYRFDKPKLKDAHLGCRRVVEEGMCRDVEAIFAHNTFTQMREMQPYVDLAKSYGYELCVIRMENEYDNVHGVPDDIVKAQRERMVDF